MRVKIKITGLTADPTQTTEVRTNLLCVTEWERETNRRLADGLPFGSTELAYWAWFMLRLAGKTSAASVGEFIRENPDADLELIDETPKNPTDAALTDGN